MHNSIKLVAPLALTFTVFLGSTVFGAPAPAPAVSSAVLLEDDKVEWDFRPFSNLIGAAGAEDKNVLVYFWMGSSGQCEQFYLDTLQNETAAGATDEYICFSADHSQPNSAKLFERYNITTVPAIRIINGHGEAVDGLNGYANVATFTTELARIQKGEGTLPAIMEQVEAAPDDLNLRNLLAGKYFDLGEQEKHDDLQNSIRNEDPDGKTDIGGSLLLSDTITVATAIATRPKDVDLKSVYKLANSLENKSAAFQAWNWLGFNEGNAGDTKKELAAIHKAWANYTEKNTTDWVLAKANWMMGMQDELSKEDKALAVEMTRHTVARIEEDYLKSCEVLGCDEVGCADDCKADGVSGYLAEHMQTLSRALYMNDLKDEALAITQACVEMQPESPAHQAREAAYSKGKSEAHHQGYNDTHPVWSPNGKDVLFTSDRDGNSELYLANAKKGSVKRLTRTQANETTGSFGAKGKTIAFNSDRFFTWTVYTMSNKGKSPAMLTKLDQAAPSGLSDPSYSPDGKKIAYTTFVNGKGEIAIADSNGKNEVILTGETDGNDQQPVWTADGKSIVYTSTRAGDSDVYSIGIDGMGDTNITNAPANSWDIDGSLSEKGELLVFASWRTGNLDIYSMSTDGTGIVNLTNSEKTEDRHPQLSPNGKQILFERKDVEGHARLWVMDVDGSDARELLDA